MTRYWSRCARAAHASQPVGPKWNRLWKIAHHSSLVNSCHQGRAKSIGIALLTTILAYAPPVWAAPSPTQLAAEILTTDATGYTTTGFALSANTLVTFTITGALGAGTGVATPTITCHGATWQLVNSQAAGDPERKIFVFRTMLGSSSGSATCSYDFAQTQVRSSYSVQEWSSVDTSGTFGSGAIVQSAPASGGSSPCAVTLSAYGSSENRPFITCRVGSATAHAPEAGWTELSDPTGVEVMSHSVQWKNAADDTSATVTVGTGTWIGVAVEVKNAVAPSCAGRLALLGVGC